MEQNEVFLSLTFAEKWIKYIENFNNNTTLEHLIICYYEKL